MSGDLQTQLDMPYARQPEVRAAAVQALIERGAGDLLKMLGLDDAADEGPLIVDGKISCPACRRWYRDDGRRSCRTPSCDLGPKSRGVTS
jgi:uncharacterized protein YbaR (Trm112 family)